MIKKHKKNIKGFTLVEIMVSVAIFTIVVTAGMGALTSMLRNYKVAQSEKRAADSLSFVLENMTREIRLGFNYYNGKFVDFDNGETSGQTRNGSHETEDGPLIGFDSSNRRGYMIYYLEKGVFMRRHFNADTGTVLDQSLTDRTQVEIKAARVSIMNASDPDDMRQPLVWIQLLAVTPGQIQTTRIIQTLVSQRDLDIYN